MKSKTPKAEGKASLAPLVRGLTRLQIERAILFVERINHGAAYGHDPELCRASNRVLTAMRHHANAPALPPQRSGCRQEQVVGGLNQEGQ